MIPSLSPYPSMKDSGVDWLGSIPSHWDVRRIKTIFRERVEKDHPDEPLLAATQSRGVIRKDQYGSRTVVATKSLETLKLVQVGDFVISLRSFQGGIEYARERGVISPAYTILIPVESRSKEFLIRLLKSKPFVEHLTLHVTGIREGQNINYESLSRSEIPLPPAIEREAIARFLDHVDQRIRRYIRAKKKQIRLLEEQKQALIHRAVTRGLDPDVPLKPSGVEWLEDIPEHWEVRRLKNLVREAVAGPYGSSLTKAMYSQKGFRVYGQQHVISDDFSLGHNFISEGKFSEMRRYQIFAGDLLISVMGTVGKAAVVPDDFEPGIINPRLVRYRPDFDTVRSHYLQLGILSFSGQCQMQYGAKGTTMDGLNMQILGAIRVAVPPLNEQDSILAALDENSARIDRSVDLSRQESRLGSGQLPQLSEMPEIDEDRSEVEGEQELRTGGDMPVSDR